MYRNVKEKKNDDNSQCIKSTEEPERKEPSGNRMIPHVDTFRTALEYLFKIKIIAFNLFVPFLYLPYY